MDISLWKSIVFFLKVGNKHIQIHAERRMKSDIYTNMHTHAYT